MPHIFPAKVRPLVGACGRQAVLGVDLREARRRAFGLTRVEQTHAVGHAPALGAGARLRALGTHGHDDVLQRTHLDGFLPAQFIGLRRGDEVVPAHAVDELHVEQVEVDRVGVDAVVGDLPDLGFAVLELLGRRIDVAQRDRGLGQRAGVRNLDAQRRVQPTIGRIEQLLNGLGLDHDVALRLGRVDGRVGLDDGRHDGRRVGLGGGGRHTHGRHRGVATADVGEVDVEDLAGGACRGIRSTRRCRRERDDQPRIRVARLGRRRAQVQVAAAATAVGVGGIRTVDGDLVDAQRCLHLGAHTRRGRQGDGRRGGVARARVDDVDASDRATRHDQRARGPHTARGGRQRERDRRAVDIARSANVDLGARDLHGGRGSRPVAHVVGGDRHHRRAQVARTRVDRGDLLDLQRGLGLGALARRVARRGRDRHHRCTGVAAARRGDEQRVEQAVGLTRHEVEGRFLERAGEDARKGLGVVPALGRGVGRVVGGLRHDGHALGIGKRGLDRRVQIGLDDRCGRRRRLDDDAHHGARVRAEARQGVLGTASGRVVAVTGEVLVARIRGRHRRARVVVDDQGLAGVLREVDDDVGALGVGDVQAGGAVVHIQDGSAALVQQVVDRRRILLGHARQPAAFAGHLKQARPLGQRVRNAARVTIDVGRPGLRVARAVGVRHAWRARRAVAAVDRHHLHFRQPGAQRVGDGSAGIGLEQIEGEGPVVRRVEDAETVGARFDFQRRVRHTVDDRRVHPGFRHQRNVAIGPGGQVVQRREHRPEPRAPMPAANGVEVGVLVRILDRLVHMGIPQRALAAPGFGVPAVVLQVHVLGHEGLVLQDQGNRVVRVGQRARGDQLLLTVVREHVARGHAGVHVQAGLTHRVVVVPLQAGTLAVGEVVGHRARTRVRHVGHVDGAGAAQVARQQLGGQAWIGRQCIGVARIFFAQRRDPLVRRAIADPGVVATVQVQVGAVLGVVGHAIGPETGAHHRRIERQEQITAAGVDAGLGLDDRQAVRADHRRAVRIEHVLGRCHHSGTPHRQQVQEPHAGGNVLGRRDDRPEVARAVHTDGLHLDEVAGCILDHLAQRVQLVDHDRRAVRVGQRHLLAARHGRDDGTAAVVPLGPAIGCERVDLDVAAHAGGVGQVGVEPVLELDDRDLEVLVKRIGAIGLAPLGGHRHRDVLVGHTVGHLLGVGRPGQGQRIDELAQGRAGSRVAAPGEQLIDHRLVGQAVGRVVARRCATHRVRHAGVVAGGINTRPQPVATGAADEERRNDKRLLVQVDGVAETRTGLRRRSTQGCQTDHHRLGHGLALKLVAHGLPLHSSNLRTAKQLRFDLRPDCVPVPPPNGLPFDTCCACRLSPGQIDLSQCSFSQ